MRKIIYLGLQLFAFLLASAQLATAQNFTETMGTVASTTLISNHESANGFDNDGFTMSGTGDLRTTSVSSGYIGASGGANVFLTNNQSKTFEISGINTLILSNIQLRFGILKSTTVSTGSDLAVQVSTDGVNYSNLSWTPLLTGSGTAVWTLRTISSGIPSTQNLRIRFVNSSTSVQYRIDDVALTATVPCVTPQISISSSVPSATLCASGGNAATQLTASVSGATVSYAYQWQFDNNGTWTNITSPTSSGTATAPFTVTQNASPSVTRSYRLVVTNSADPTCTADASQLITIIPDPVLDVTSTNVTCFGLNNGTASATLSGGTATNNYTYNWSPGSPTGDGTLSVSDLTPGTYTLTATGTYGCNATATVQITEPTKVNISATNTSILCNGGTSDVTVSTWGGTLPYSTDDAGTYTVGAGTYVYNVVDANGCSASTTLDVIEPSALTVNAGGDETVFAGYGPMSCASLDAAITGGTPSYSAVWTSTNSGGGIGETLTACPTVNEVYTVSVTDANGCTASDDLSICVVDVTCYAGNSGIQKVEMCQVPPGNPSNAHTICVDASAVPAHLAIGCQLGACGELATACGNVSAKEISTTQASAAMTVAPNPTDNFTTISLTLSNAGDYNVVMFDMMGQKVMDVFNGNFGEYENMTFDVDMSSLENGIYMVGVSNGEQMIENIRIVKQ